MPRVVAYAATLGPAWCSFANLNGVVSAKEKIGRQRTRTYLTQTRIASPTQGGRKGRPYRKTTPIMFKPGIRKNVTQRIRRNESSRFS